MLLYLIYVVVLEDMLHLYGTVPVCIACNIQCSHGSTSEYFSFVMIKIFLPENSENSPQIATWFAFHHRARKSGSKDINVSLYFFYYLPPEESF